MPGQTGGQGTLPSSYGVAAATNWTYLKDMLAYLANPNVSGMYGQWNHPRPCPTCPGEGGVDLTAPPGTPVYALGTGPLESAGTFNSVGQGHPGAVISQRVNVPGIGPEDIYYQHINLLPGFQNCYGGNCGGQIIQAGQQIGTVGDVGETEIGFNANWGSLYGPSNHPGPWPDDPRPWIAALIKQAPVAQNNQGLGGVGNQPGTVCDTPVVGGLICWLQSNIASWAEHVAFFLIGLVLIIIGFIILIHPNPQELLRAGEVAAV